MDLHAGWCQLCWAKWSTWFMRAGGSWIDLEHRIRCSVGVCEGDRGMPCKDCRQQHMLQELVDEAERMAAR
jgi:hypothetical protein